MCGMSYPRIWKAWCASTSESRTSGEPAVFRFSEVVAALQGANPGVVAVAEGQLVGAAVGRVDGDRAWVLRVALHPAWRNLGLGTALLSALEQRMRAAGAVLVAAVLPEDETGAAALVNSGFRLRHGLTYYEKVQSVTAEGSAVLSSLGATVPPAGLWERLAGMAEAKQLVERRIVLPLANPGAADEHGVEPPQAVVLFGPRAPARAPPRRPSPPGSAGPSWSCSPPGSPWRTGSPTGSAAASRRSPSSTTSWSSSTRWRRSRGPATSPPPSPWASSTNCSSPSCGSATATGGFSSAPPTPSPRWTPRSCGTAASTTSCPSARPTTRPAPRSGPATSPGPAPRPTPPSWPTPAFTPADIRQAARTVAQAVFERTLGTGTRAHPTTEDFLRTISRTRPTVTTKMALESADHTIR